ncbi:MAG TPA: hypothetical protein VM327_00390 [Candidatus Thermoplasmatota archaeon]|nr:hypothetical protein [Candidatus Thermoplasmatota archaeon]
MESRRWHLVALVAAHLVASLLHFADNALRFGRYHDAATPWLTPGIVVAAWFVQSAIGSVGLVLHRRGRKTGRPILMAFAALGFAGILHYAAGMPDPDAWMHALIALEAVTGAALLVGLGLSKDADPSASAG